MDEIESRDGTCNASKTQLMFWAKAGPEISTVSWRRCTVGHGAWGLRALASEVEHARQVYSRLETNEKREGGQGGGVG